MFLNSECGIINCLSSSKELDESLQNSDSDDVKIIAVNPISNLTPILYKIGSAHAQILLRLP